MSRALLLSLTLAMLPGCLFVPYAFPTVSHRPELTVNGASDEVLAIWATRQYGWNAIFISAGPQEKYEAVRCQLFTSPQATVESESSIGLAFGVAGIYCCPMALMLPLPGFTITKSEPVLLLYRPGYRLKRIYGWSSESVVHWEPAESMEEQREAISVISGTYGMNTSFSANHLSIDDVTTYREFIQKERLRLEEEEKDVGKGLE